MLSSRARATSLAALLAIGGLGALATPAHAAADGATIKLGSADVWVGDELTITGTCPGGSTSAVVTVEQEDLIVGEKAVNVSRNGSFTADLDLMDAWGGGATASVDCMGYTGSTGKASIDFDINEEDWDFEEIEVALSQQKVALGGTLTVSATCPKGSNLAAVVAVNEEADEPFFVQELTPAASGAISAKVKIAATDGVAPEVGNAIAAVLCAEDGAMSAPQLLGDTGLAGKLLAGQPMTAMAEEEEFALTAIGEAEFTITPAVAAPSAPTPPTAPGTVTAPAAPAADPAAPSSTRAASAVPQQLAYTGSEPAPLAAIALAMIAAGGVAIRRARRA
jgi:hypothetical protein